MGPRSGSGLGEPVAYCTNALATRREQTKNRKGASVHDNLAIYKNLVLAISPMLGVYVDLQLSSQLRRHPDGVKAGDSVRAIANNDSRHRRLLCR